MNNNTSYETQAIDLSLLSVLDITKEGKVVSVEKWVELWTLVFQHINKIDAFCVDMQATLDNWHASEVALNEIIEDMQMKYASLSTGFTHYGEAPPQNPHIKFWVRRMEDIATHCFITNADIDKTYIPESPNAQSGIAVAEAVEQVNMALSAAVYKGFVAKENGKGLSTNDFTDEDKEKLGSALQADDISDKMDKFGEVELDGTRLGDVTASVKNFQLLNLTGESGLGLGVHEARLHSKEAAILSKLNTETGDSTEVAVGDGIVNLSSGKDDVILNGVATPTDDNHGTNKQYVDEAVAEAVGVANDYTDKAIKSSKTYANNTFAPAIKNTVSGSVLAVHDVSPMERDLGVNVRSKNLMPTNTLEVQGIGGWASKQLIKANIPSGVYTFSCEYEVLNENNSTVAVAIRDIDENYINEAYGNNNVLKTTFTVTNGLTIHLYSNFSETAIDSDVLFKNIQLEVGSTATEYTPYTTDFSGISVSRLGKNLFDINQSNATPYKIYGMATEIVDDMVHIYGVSTISNLVSFNFITNNQAYLRGKGYPISLFAVSGVPEGVKLYGFRTESEKEMAIQIKLTADSEYDMYFKIMVTAQSTVGEYEPYKELQTVTANADGTVAGLTSLSPNITVTTDTDGVVIDMTYNADTKMYIDNKLAEISAAIVNS